MFKKCKEQVMISRVLTAPDAAPKRQNIYSGK